MRVLLPLPDTPVMQTNLPSGIPTSTVAGLCWCFGEQIRPHGPKFPTPDLRGYYRTAGAHTGRAYSYSSWVMRVTLLPSASIMYT